MRKKILFFPIEVGIAHIARSLAIAEKLLSDGHDIYFALPKRKQPMYSASPVRFIDIPDVIGKDSMELVKYYKDKNKLRKYVKDEMEIVSDIKPDFIFVDYRISALITGAISKIPTYFIIGSSGIPYRGYLPSLGLPKWLHRAILPILSKLIWKTKKDFFKKLLSIAKEYDPQISISDLIDKPRYVVAENKEYLPFKRSNLKIEYVGPLHWSGFKNEYPKWLSEIHPSGKTIYLTFGGTGFDKEKLINLSIELVDRGHTVVVSASSIAGVDEFPKKDNLYVTKYLPGLEISKRVDLVICHGGIGTLMQALQAGKPTVSIPFNPDQVLHGLRFQELGLGRVVVKWSIPTVLKIIGGDILAFEELGKNTTVVSILKTVEEVLDDRKSYDLAIKRWKKNLTEDNLSSFCV